MVRNFRGAGSAATCLSKKKKKKGDGFCLKERAEMSPERLHSRGLNT